MAGPFKIYDKTLLELAKGNLNLSSTNADKFKVMLLNAYTPARTHNFVSDVINASTAEATNLTSNRVSLTSINISVSNASAPLWNSANVNFEANGGYVVANYCVIYDDESGTADANTNVICYCAIGAQNIANTTILTLNLTNGIFTISDSNTATP